MARRTQIIRPQVFWDPGEKKYAVKTGYSEKYIQDLKTMLDHGVRFDGINKLWFVDEDDLKDLLVILRDHWPEDVYGKVDFIPKPDPSKQRQQTSAQVNGAHAAALTMFEVGGYETARKVYSLLLRQYHPDVSDDPQAHDKATKITIAWKELKSHMGWS